MPVLAIGGYNTTPMQSKAQPAAERQKIPARRILALLLPAFFSLGLLALLLVWEERNPPGWQRAMENHLAVYVSSPRDTLSAGKTTVAQLPFVLAPESPFQPVTPSVHYQIGPLPTDVRPDSTDSLGKKPLPYPVLELYCIDLSQTGAGVAATRYLVAEHRDLHSSDWIVYLPSKRASPQAVDAAWDELGCNEQ